MSKNTKTTARPAAKSASKSEDAKPEEPKPSVLPNDILRAIVEARKKDPKDKHGDGAFRIDKSRLRAFQNKTDKKKKATYIPFQVHVRGEWVGVNIRVLGVKTESTLKAPEEREYGVTLSFRKSSTFTRKDKKTGDEVVERYGEAVVAAYEAFQRIVKRMVDDGELENGKTDALSRVQYEAKKKNDAGKVVKETLEDPIFRVDLRTNDDDSEFTDLKDDIRDVRRKMKKPKAGELMPYDRALDGPDDDADSQPLTPLTAHTFFKMKTPCFGVHCMDQACMSNTGISAPSYFPLLAAKKPKGARPTYEAHFDKDEMEAWGEVEAYDEEGEDADGAEGTGGADPETNNAEEAAPEAYDDVLDAVAEHASDNEAEAETEAADGTNDADEVDEAALDALEETVAEPEPEPAPKSKGKAPAKAPAKGKGKK